MIINFTSVENRDDGSLWTVRRQVPQLVSEFKSVCGDWPKRLTILSATGGGVTMLVVPSPNGLGYLTIKSWPTLRAWAETKGVEFKSDRIVWKSYGDDLLAALSSSASQL